MDLDNEAVRIPTAPQVPDESHFGVCVAAYIQRRKRSVLFFIGTHISHPGKFASYRVAYFASLSRPFGWLSFLSLSNKLQVRMRK